MPASGQVLVDLGLGFLGLLSQSLPEPLSGMIGVVAFGLGALVLSQRLLLRGRPLVQLDGARVECCMEVTQPPGIATPLHVHHREAEVFYVLAGPSTRQARPSRNSSP